MATYKVLQDIEAEDKLLGPLTLKQFIFGAITLGIGFIEFTLITTTALGIFRWPFVALFLLPMLVFGFLATPISRDQPNEVWLLARMRFLLKPRVRIWNQDGLSQLVTITVPKRIEHFYTNGLTQTEVKSRLHALASTLDSRGWAVKNVDTNLFAQPGYLASSGGDSDRLVGPSSLPQEVPTDFISAADDMLDPLNNSTAQHLDQLVQASTQNHKQKLVEQLQQKTPVQTPENYWFMNQTPAPQAELPTNYATFTSQQVVAPGTTDVHPAAQPTADEQAFAENFDDARSQAIAKVNSHMKTIQPLHDRNGNIIITPPAPTPDPATQSVDDSNAQAQTTQPALQVPIEPAKTQTSPANPGILELAHNDDLNIATIARQAQRIQESDDEVVISLH